MHPVPGEANPWYLFVSSAASPKVVLKFAIMFKFLILGGGGVQRQGKGQRLMTTFCWQHAKVESTKSNPPRC